MQKKKALFQVIPNYRINGVPNWKDSKEVPAEQGGTMILACVLLRPLPGFLCA
jgi:hypothetical protein